METAGQGAGAMRAVIYARISRVERKKETVESIEEQIAECMLYAQQRGWQIVGVFKDNLTASDFSTKDRPDFLKLMALVRAGQVDVILVTEQSRLDRKLWNVLELIEYARSTPFRKIIRVRDEDEVDLTTEAGINRTIDQANRDRHEAAIISQRTSTKKKVRAKLGKFNGGQRPYGYEKDGTTVRESEAQTVREIVGLLLKGRTLWSIVTYLNDNGITTVHGRRWQPTSLRVLLQSKRLIGIRTHHGVEYEAAWPAILDRDTWEQVQHILEANALPSRGRVWSKKYLLTGILVCGHCGKLLVGFSDTETRRGEPKRRRRYYCKRQDPYGRDTGCGKVGRMAPAVEALVTEMVLYRYDAEGMSKAYQTATEGTEYETTLSEYQATKASLSELLRDYYKERNKYARDEMAKLKAELERELEAITARMGQIESTRALVSVPIGQTMREAWANADLDLRRSFISLLVEKVIVHPGKSGSTTWPPKDDPELLERVGEVFRFDPSKIEVVWRV
jgi:DNA invertase Pin-like site-specific DNA recombinase